MADAPDKICPKCQFILDFLEKPKDDDPFGKLLKTTLINCIDEVWEEFIKRHPTYETMSPDEFGREFSLVCIEIMENILLKLDLS